MCTKDTLTEQDAKVQYYASYEPFHRLPLITLCTLWSAPFRVLLLNAHTNNSERSGNTAYNSGN
jgi:hypothetical protein